MGTPSGGVCAARGTRGVPSDGVLAELEPRGAIGLGGVIGLPGGPEGLASRVPSGGVLFAITGATSGLVSANIGIDGWESSTFFGMGGAEGGSDGGVAGVFENGIGGGVAGVFENGIGGGVEVLLRGMGGGVFECDAGVESLENRAEGGLCGAGIGGGVAGMGSGGGVIVESGVGAEDESATIEAGSGNSDRLIGNGNSNGFGASSCSSSSGALNMGWKRLVPASSLCLISATATPMGGGGGRFGSAQDLAGLA
jgi:hypothetical protein